MIESFSVNMTIKKFRVICPEFFYCHNLIRFLGQPFNLIELT